MNERVKEGRVEGKEKRRGRRGRRGRREGIEFLHHG